MFNLKSEDTLFLFVDFQEKLMPAMKDAEKIINISKKAYEFAKMTDTKYLFTTQYKKGLGGLVDAFKSEDENVLDKSEFSCYKNAEIKKTIDDLKVKNIILLGQEAHICVFQTARDLIEANYNVLIMMDAVTSRTNENKDNALQLLRHNKVSVVNLELVMFDILKDSKHPKFKEAQALIK